MRYLKLPADKRPSYGTIVDELRAKFYSEEWWRVFDIIEFLLANFRFQPGAYEHLKQSLNMALTNENSAYPIVENEIVEITDQTEIETIETALDKAVSSIRIHLERSLALLSDRKAPDFRNSIKEAISAVEAACQTVSGKSNATLGDCLKVLREKQPFHPAFEQALNKLYGYTNDHGGIRHALTDTSDAVSYADAKFMLVAASSFINYLWAKAAELRIPIK